MRMIRHPEASKVALYVPTGEGFMVVCNNPSQFEEVLVEELGRKRADVVLRRISATEAAMEDED